MGDTIGQQFVKGRMQPMRTEYRALVDSDTTTEVDGNAGMLAPASSAGLPMAGARQRRYVRDLLRTVPTEALTVAYAGEITADGGDGVTAVAEAGAKPEVALQWVGGTVRAKKLAGYVQATDEIVQDVPGFSSYLDVRLPAALGNVENAQLLNGDGVGANLLGFLQWTGLETQGATNNDPLVTLANAIAELEDNGAVVDGIVMNTTDYWATRLTRRSSGLDDQGVIDGRGDFWNVPTFRCPELAAGTALVGAFTYGATLRPYGPVTVRQTSSHSTDFVNGKVTVVCEVMEALTVHRPDWFSAVTIDTSA